MVSKNNAGSVTTDNNLSGPVHRPVLLHVHCNSDRSPLPIPFKLPIDNFPDSLHVSLTAKEELSCSHLRILTGLIYDAVTTYT